MNKWDTVAIVGVGLIGGSIGLALRRRKLARRVVGIGRRASSLRAARQVGAVDETTTDLTRGVAEAELAIVCTPVDQIADHVFAIAEARGGRTLITDAGSTKQQIVASIEARLPSGGRFVGSHPLAGSERGGPAEADAALYDGQTVVVTPTERCARRDVLAVRRFWQALGARVESMSPAEHDRALAMTSHLPHLVAAALAATTPADVLRLTASGWRDTTRIAAGDPALWRQIFTHNREHLLDATDQFTRQLNALTAALSREGDEILESLLTDAKKRRDAAKPNQRGSEPRKG